MTAWAIRLSFLVVLGLTGATAAQPSMVEVCSEASKLYYRVDTALPVNAESFAELSPPRVRMDVKLISESELTGVAGVLAKERGEPTTRLIEITHDGILCRFETANAPYRLAGFCGSDGCFATNQERVEEVKVLLERQAQ